MEASGRVRRLQNVYPSHHSSDSEESSENSDNDSYPNEIKYWRDENNTKKRKNSSAVSTTSSKRSRIANGVRPSISSDGENFKVAKKREYTTRKPECYNRSAVMARQNRLKKKRYMEDLEGQIGNLKNENKNLKRLLKNQSGMLRDLKHEKRYLKSVIENRTEIGALLKKFRDPMENKLESHEDSPVAYSAMNYKRQVPIARKTAYPFKETEVKDPSNRLHSSLMNEPLLSEVNVMSPLLTTPLIDDIFRDDFNDFGFSFPTPEQSISLSDDFVMDRFDMFEFPEEFLPPVPQEEVVPPLSKLCEPCHVTEHNYTIRQSEENVGVCFHVVNGKVSLEFCSKCHQNAKKDYLSSGNIETSESEERSENEK